MTEVKEENNRIMQDGLPRGMAIVVSAPSGTGKTTLCKMLTEEFKDIRLSVSFTTRVRRRGEIDGVSYHFISDDEFDKMTVNSEFIEWANIFGKRYGTAIRSIYNGYLYDTLLEIDVQGAEKMRKYYDEIHRLSNLVTIFIKPPSQKALIERLNKRGQISDEELRRRLAAANDEIEKSKFYNYTITNDIIEKAYLKLKSVIIAERCRNTKIRR